jgi:hypothetical protein
LGSWMVFTKDGCHRQDSSLVYSHSHSLCSCKQDLLHLQVWQINGICAKKNVIERSRQSKMPIPQVMGCDGLKHNS